MIRTHWMTSSAAAKAYYRAADYYATSPGEWLGQGARMLGLVGGTSPEQFDSLADNLDPRTGKPLTTFTRDGRRVGLDMTFNSTKSVGIARELAGPDNTGDPRIEEAHREAVAYTMKFVEADMQGRVRTGGRSDRLKDNRTTGNLVAYRVTHRDTRINADDQKPDMSLHDHVFIFNATFDPIEGKWKAAEMGKIKHDAPYFEAIYHNRLAQNLRALGYGIRRKEKAFEIAGVSDDLVKKFSRRRQYIKAVAEKLGISSPEGMSKLGATTRLGKAKELADDLNGYYVSRLTDKERSELQGLKGKGSYVSSEKDAVRYALAHCFERQSVAEERKVYETAIRHGIGSVTVEGVEAEAKRQGLLMKDGEATTRDVLAEEGRIIAFAREGKGTMRPLAAYSDSGYGAGERANRSTAQVPAKADTATLSPEQQAVSSYSKNPLQPPKLSPEQLAVCQHVWSSPDQVILIRGAAGTGKTHTMKATIAGIDRPVTVLAPSADASRGVLRREGFKDADTVASFLGNEQAQQKAKVIWVDEAGLLPIRDLARLVDIAKRNHARLILQGDPKQHKSVARHGNMFKVLQEFAGLPVAELKDVRRQKGRYKEAVKAIDLGDILKAHDILNELGYIRQTPVWDHNKPLVDDYMASTEAGKSVLVVAPTHAEGDEITGEIRKRLRGEGKLGEERVFDTLKPLGWTDAEKADPQRYDGTEVVQFHRNSGAFKAGDRVTADRLLASGYGLRPGHFSVYSQSHCVLAAGDAVRITGNGWDTVLRDGQRVRGKHRLDNGSLYTVAGFTKEGDVALTNGWVLGKEFGHLAHGYVTTSYASQGKTVDRVLIAMGHESLPAVNAAQFYVSVSRGRERATIYSNLNATTIREAIQRQDERRSATELLGEQVEQKKRNRRDLVDRMRAYYKRLRERLESAITEVALTQVRHEGFAR